MTPYRHVTDDERRARLATRHALASQSRVASAEAVTGAMTVLHATEPATVYLSCLARMTSPMVTDVDQALYTDRTLVKQLAMRRTLFVFPRDLLSAAWAGPSARVAATERARMAKDLVAAGIAENGNDWLDRARTEILAVLNDAPDGRPAQDIRLAIPMIDVKVEVPPGDSWTASRVLTLLGATADIVRGANTGGWHTSRPRWTRTHHWLDDQPDPQVSTADSEQSRPSIAASSGQSTSSDVAGSGRSTPSSAADGYREIMRRWLHTFGPGTEDDLVWWLGATKAIARRALADVGAVPVTLERGALGWLLPDDLDEVAGPGQWAALLPVLDPTVMGWQGRDFYLGAHRDLLFERRGNAGTTAWVTGRAVGCWVQDAEGTVVVRLVEPVPASAQRLLDMEAQRLTALLAGFRVSTVYPSPAMKP